jgi:alanyl-tRNA synthetase
VNIEEMPLDEAKKRGAVALFGEKYGDVVRVVSMGGYTIELCGGTHLDNTAKAGSFAIQGEFSVASGVRRIEATVGEATLESLKSARDSVHALTAALKATSASDALAKLEQQAAELSKLRRELEAVKAGRATGDAARLLNTAQDVAGLKVVAAEVEAPDVPALRTMGDVLRDKEPKIVAVLAAKIDGKLSFLAVCGKDAVSAGMKAGDLVKAVTAITGGSGGGKPDSAMGGGKDASKLGDALKAVAPFVSEKLGK